MKWKTGLIMVVGLIAAACGGGNGATTTTAAPAGPATTPAVATTTTGAGEMLEVVASAAGDALVDAEGRSVYVFLPDAQGASTCYEACESNWPPLSGSVGAGSGVDGSLLASAARNDGSAQVTYNGWPLYYFAGDAAPGDINGQGINDVWFLVSATGDPIA